MLLPAAEAVNTVLASANGRARGVGYDGGPTCFALLGAGLALASPGFAPPAFADEPAKVTITLKDHKFSPAEPTVPAGKPIVIEVVQPGRDAGGIRKQGACGSRRWSSGGGTHHHQGALR